MEKRAGANEMLDPAAPAVAASEMVFLDAMRCLVTCHHMDRVRQCTEIIFLAVRFGRAWNRGMPVAPSRAYALNREVCGALEAALESEREPRDTNVMFRVLKVYLAQILFDASPSGADLPFLRSVQAVEWFAERTNTTRLVPSDAELQEHRPLPQDTALWPTLREAMAGLAGELALTHSLNSDPSWVDEAALARATRAFFARDVT